MAYKFLPKQGDIDRLIAKINKKVLRDTNLCVDLRDLKAAYLTSPHFRDIYLYLLQNRMPLGKGAARRLDQNARNYLILDGLLFKILDDGEGKLDTVLCIPIAKLHILLNAYHSSIIGGHTGITKCYHTISQRFYCPNLAENLRAYITGCHVCQLFKKGKEFKRPDQKRINLNVPAMTKISMDIKQMPVNKGYSHILVLLCEVTNYMVALPLMSTRTPHILEAFQRGYLAYFVPPTHIVCDQDPTFTSSLMETFVTQLNIKVILVSPTNHQSLQAKHGIKSLSGLLVKHLSTVWSWHSVLPYSMLCYNGYSSPNLNGYSPYDLVFGHKMTLCHELEIKVDTVVSGTFKEYYEKLKRNLQYMGERLQKFRSQRLDLLNKDREYQAFEVGQIVYQFELLEHVLGSRIYTKVLVVCHFFVFIKIHSKWLHPVLTSFAHCCSCQVLVQRPVPTCLDCFFQFLEEMWDAIFVRRKRTRYHVSVSWIMTTQAFILHSHKKTILVVKIIVSLQNSPHHHLQTTFKDAEFIMLIYFLFIASHFSTLYYNIQRYFLFSLRTFH